MTYDCLNDKFYDNVLEPQYDCNWRTIDPLQLSELSDILQGATIIKMEHITDGKNICGIMLYLKKQSEKFVITINSPDYVDDNEKDMYFYIVQE